MHAIETVTLLLLFVIGLAIFAKKLRTVFPVLLTLAGLLISFLPGLPTVAIDPSVVLLVFLPPILYSAAWYTNWLDFKKNLEPIIVMALGLVLVTCVGVALVAQQFLPGFTLATGFLLGAIVSPPDVVAATAVLKNLPVPPKAVSVLEGESLVNDASALIAFQFALAAITTGQFSVAEASGRFAMVVLGGIATGLAVGFLAYKIHQWTDLEPALETLLTFVTAYGAYLAAEKLHVNGVLSVVTAGLFMGAKQSKVHSSAMRLQAVAVWDFMIVFLNSLIFILIGLQLPLIAGSVAGAKLSALIGYGALVTTAAMVIRFLYVYIADFLSRRVRRWLRLPPVFPSLKHTTVLAFTSMRGVVSLAAAFSIPVLLADGVAFPQRNLILFITFSVVVFTLLLQGLSLPFLIRWLKFEKPPTNGLLQVRQQLAQAAHQHIDELTKRENVNEGVAAKLKAWHNQHLVLQKHQPGEETAEQALLKRLQKESIAVRRRLLRHLRQNEKMEAEWFHQLENELDLEEASLEKPAAGQT